MNRLECADRAIAWPSDEVSDGIFAGEGRHGAVADRDEACPTSVCSAALLMADGRFPAGGYAHSGGLEGAVDEGALKDLASLRAFLEGRLWTAGLSGGCFSAASWIVVGGNSISVSGNGVEDLDDSWHRLDREMDVRVVSPAQRRTSRSLGRQLLRTSATVWPSPLLSRLSATFGEGVHYPVAVGTCAAVAGLSVEETALITVYGSVVMPAFASLKLLALDPAEVTASVVVLGTQIDQVASMAVDAARSAEAALHSWARLPAPASPLLDYYSEAHAEMEVRLFAS